MFKKILSVTISVVIFTLIVTPAFAKEDKHTYVLVHGLGGYGDTSLINEVNPYWGSITGNLSDYLKSEGYSVFEASVGPFSSSWDRACELYAQLTGTTVDYGEAHSKEHGHNRFGATYDVPIIEDWNSSTNLNLIGHSFGGATVRTFAHLMEYGDANELNSTAENVSDLFKGGKGKYIHSVTTLCSPHNGSSLYDILNKFPYMINTLLGSVALLDKAFSDTFVEDVYITNLQHFKAYVFSAGIDNAGYELSYEGATELNNKIKQLNNTYYFSYASSCTSQRNGNYFPDENTFILLKLPATLIGSYKHPVLNKENDGLVNVNSALYPFTDSWQQFNINDIKTGKWNVMPILNGHHGTIIGMDGNTEEIHNFYLNLFNMIESLESR